MPIKVKPLRESSRASFYFIRPIFDWREVFPRFFKMVYECLGSQIRVQVSDFTGAAAPASMADVRARWAVYGGQSSVTLNADRLEFDFPALFPNDLQLVWHILRTFHDVFPTYFSDCQYDRIESVSNEHLAMPTDPGVTAYLQRYSNNR